ncbi:ABC transporter permease subunit [Aliamphritea hakodatensis]|uniref:ABC transporter permease subunit n=1 Tax=Aliamphritea hakodatensis TaxID=2895352 RepID=UPI0022FD441C|nr:ABC transporter permease subunit [Aliamphritea hakodatensis]
MLVVALLVLTGNIAVSVLAFQGLIGFSGQGADLSIFSDAYFWGVLSFSVKQAVLSAVLSVMLAWPVARGLYFLPTLRGQQSFLRLCLLAFVMPTLVLITGLVVLFGRSGWLLPLLPDDWNLYGLHGILLAHIYLNMPFAIRMLRQQYNNIPDPAWRLALQLKLSHWQRFCYIELPVLRPVLVMLLGFVFILCFNSFAVVLALGGGPQATTLEVAIYQALKYDFNIPEALSFAWTQLIIAGGLFVVLYRKGSGGWLSVDLPDSHWRPLPGKWAGVAYRTGYGLVWVFLLLPLVSLVFQAARNDLLEFDYLALLQPILLSALLGIMAACLSVIIGYLLLLPVREARYRGMTRRQWLLEWLATHTLIAPAMVTSVGLYVLLLPQTDLDQYGLVLVVVLNTLAVVPFVVQQLRPRLLQYDAQYDQLVRNLKFSPLLRLQAELPYLRQVLINAFALGLLLAIGDVAVFAIFGHQDLITLPWLIYSYAGTYRMDEAAMASLVLLLMCAGLMKLFVVQKLPYKVKDKR